MKKSERKEGIYIRDLFLLLFVFTFLFFLCRNGESTDWSMDPIVLGVVEGGVYHNKTYTIKFAVTSESSSERYRIEYYTPTGGWQRCNLTEVIRDGNDLIQDQEINNGEFAGVGDGGAHSYEATWDVSNTNTSGIKIRVTMKIGPEGSPQARPWEYFKEFGGTKGFGIYNIKPNIRVVRPKQDESWSGTRTIVWSVENPWPDDRYKIQYKPDPDDDYPWIDITTTETSPVTSSPVTYTYNWDTTTAIGQPSDKYKVRIYGTVSNVEGVSGYFTIDQNRITSITIDRPTASDKCRGEIRIEWSITGNERIDEKYDIFYYSATAGWQPIGQGLRKGTTSYNWNTDNVVDGRYKIKVTATSSNVSVESNWFVVDNTDPTIKKLNSISPELSIIPDTDVGNIGRYHIGVKKSNWYNTKPQISITAEDPIINGSFSGIKAVAYRFKYQDFTGQDKFTDWKAIKYNNGDNQIKIVDITCDVEGKNINLEVVVVDDAQYSLDPSSLLPDYEDVYNLLGPGNNNGNSYSESRVLSNKNINVDFTPPSFRILVDKLPDGPIINGIQWYKTPPVIYIEANDNVSGVLKNVVAFTVDGTDIPVIDFSNVTLDNNGKGIYTIDIFNGERVVFKKYLERIGIEKRDNNNRDNNNDGIYFPVFNSYGKPLKVRIWDEAGNISEQVVGHPWYIEERYDNFGNKIIIRQEEIPLYVDTVPPETIADLSGVYMPTQFKDIGTYQRNYTDIWRHNKDFPRPEDCPPPSNYPFDYIDFIYYASLNNRFSTPLSISLTATDSLYEIFEGNIINKRPLTILPGHPDYDPRYDFFFSDFTNDNLGSGVLQDLTGIQYRTTDNNKDILVDLRDIIKINNKFYAVGEKGVIVESSDGENWNLVTVEDSSTLYGIYGTSQTNIWACGENGRVFKFDGNRWNKINRENLGISENNPPTFYSVYVEDDTIWVVGTGGTILKSEDGGNNWSKENRGVSVNLHRIRKISGNIYVVGASGTILKYDGT
ncbi:MAG: YCF48-related protein, partial [Candidatus Omnitrophica bacterium]|nr:YCF48-related protein [Candidatus Omnitrophota bacterium]